MSFSLTPLSIKKSVKDFLKANGLKTLLYAWVLFFVVLPLVLTFSLSFFSRDTYGGFNFDLTFKNIFQLFESTYLKILIKSIYLASITSFLCAIIGFPISYVIACASPKKKILYYALLLIPFWTNFIIRTYALRKLFSPMGLNIEIPTLLLVQLGMLMNYLPLFVIPCAVAIERLPASLWESACDLGASTKEAWIKVIFPLLKKPIAHALLMVFVPALGEFVIPDILGGAQGFYLGSLISEQFLKARNWPFGSALSLLLLLCASLIVYIQMKQTQDNKKGSGI